MATPRTVPQPVLRVLRAAAILGGFLPLALLIYGYLNDTLSVNPLDDITDATGTWTLRFLMITLAITPLRKITGAHQLAGLRKMAGLFAFLYGTLHLFTYLSFDKFFSWEDILLDIPKRRFILVGFTAWLLMLPLAVTSYTKITTWMGGKRWRMLHRVVYGIGVLGVLHYYWLVKFDTVRPLAYGTILAVLLLYRIVEYLYRRRRLSPSM